MIDIDFLPADYVCVQRKRQKNNWLRGFFVAVVALMAVGWAAQQDSIRVLTARRDRMKDQAATVLSQLDSGDGLRAELKHLQNDARLLDGLRAQVPPTRWLKAIVDALPADASLTEIRSEIDEDAVPAALRQPPGAGPGKPAAPEAASPVQQDLDRLALLTPRRALAISLRGAAADDLDVSQFLSALNATGLFQRVQLLFTDQLGQGDKPLRSFAIRLRTRSVNSRPDTRPTAAPVASDNPRHVGRTPTAIN